MPFVSDLRIMDMPRVQAILDTLCFAENMQAIEDAECDRTFCRHGLPHVLDVARVAWILNLERGLSMNREVVYAASLLHDIGRAAQYQNGEDHDVAGARLAGEILDALPEGVRFSPAERADIIEAVRGHRGRGFRILDAPADEGEAFGLGTLIAEADHVSRPCFACSVQGACYWPEERKNLRIRI